MGNLDPGCAVGVAVSGSSAYVADYDAGLQVIDVSNPAAPTLVGDVDTPDLAQTVSISGSIAYLADHWGGLLAVDVSIRDSRGS
jgi:hypothetical protein